MTEDILRYFNDRAEEYDGIVRRQIVDGRNLLAQMVRADQLHPDLRVLDLGCGPGYLAEALAPHVGQVVAMDLAPNMVALTQQRLNGVGIKNASFVVGDADSLPLAAGVFDLILSQSTLQFADLTRALPAMRRSLRSGGAVSISHMAIPSHKASSRLRTTLGRIRLTAVPSLHIARTQGARAGLRHLQARLRHNWFSQRFDPSRLDRATAMAIYRRELPGCEIAGTGRYFQVRWQD